MYKCVNPVNPILRLSNPTSITRPDDVPQAMLLSFLLTVTARTASDGLPSCRTINVFNQQTRTNTGQ